MRRAHRLAPVAAVLLAGCATQAPLERYAQPPAGPDVAEVELRLMQRSRNRSAAMYLAGAVRCHTSVGMKLLAMSGKFEEPDQVLARSADSPTGWSTVRLPAGQTLPLRFRYFGPGEEYRIDLYVMLAAGARYVFDHEIPGTRVTLVDARTGLPPVSLPTRVRRDEVQCP